MTEDYFGVCPTCGKCGVVLNVESDHWMVCEEHQIAWYIGSNLFSEWRNESPSYWVINKHTLSQCTIIDPDEAHKRTAALVVAAETDLEPLGFDYEFWSSELSDLNI